MSACNSLLWAGLGVAVGYALALYVDQQADDQEGDGDGDRGIDDSDIDVGSPNLRVVDGGDDRPRSRVSDEHLDRLLSDDD